MPRAAAVLLLCLGALIGAAVAASAARAQEPPVIHAHRGGAISFGVPDSYEDTLEAFTRRVAQTPGAWLEMDALVSRDGVPYVLHDSTVDRTTDCEGVVGELTAAELDRCRVDKLGVGSQASGTFVDAPVGGPVVRLPRLVDVLALARRTGASVNLEIKRIPGDPGYVPGDTAFATRIMEVVRDARLDPQRLIVQSFDPSNLEVARAALPGVQLSLLSLANDASGVALCASRGYAWYSPDGAPSAATVRTARDAGVKVVPYTLNSAEEVRAAAAAGVDALITDDVPLARQALGLEPFPVVPGPSAAPVPGSPAMTPSEATTAQPATSPSSAATGPAPSPVPTAPAPTPAPVPVSPVTAPKPVSVALPNRSRRAVLAARRLVIVLRGPTGTTARVRVTRGGVVVAAGTVRLTGTDARRARLPVTRRGLGELRRSRRVTLRVRLTVAGETTTRRLVLR